MLHFSHWLPRIIFECTYNYLVVALSNVCILFPHMEHNNTFKNSV